MDGDLKSKPAEAAGVADAGGLAPLISAWPRVAGKIDGGAFYGRDDISYLTL
jgi:hypothetical protein